LNRIIIGNKSWQRNPLFRDIDLDFLSYGWQVKNTYTDVQQLEKLFALKKHDLLFDDVKKGIAQHNMNFRITPHVLSLIDWEVPLKRWKNRSMAQKSNLSIALLTT
jgi:L-lysine 2,3-aminomutase